MKLVFGFPKNKKKPAVLAGEDLVCVNLQDQEAKVAVITSKLQGDRQVSQFLSFSGQVPSADDLSDRVYAALQQLPLKNPKFVGVVSSNLVVTRNIEIPSRDPDEIREILSLQASRHTPYARDEIIIDYINLGVFKSVYTKVLFIIVPRTVAARYYNLATRLRWRIEKIVFISEALARFFCKHLNLGGERLPICILQVDSTVTEFVIMFRGAALFARSIPVGAKHFAVAKEGYQARFTEELRRSFDTYQGENIDAMPSQVLLTGAIQGLDDLSFTIEDTFRMTVRRLTDLNMISMDAEVKAQCAGQNLAVLSAAAPGLLVDELAVDLSPEESRLKRRMEERSKELIKAGVLGMVLLGLLCVSFASHIYLKTARLDQLTKRYEPIRKETKSLEETYARVRAVKGHLAGRGKALNSLAELCSLLPNDIYLADIKYDTGGKMTIKGTSYTKISIFGLVDKMGSSKIFRNVQTKYITGRSEEGLALSDFEIATTVT
ncbi:MAG: PilN domain-containing protein [Candidatus Omnitrophota bacterium]